MKKMMALVLSLAIFFPGCVTVKEAPQSGQETEIIREKRVVKRKVETVIESQDEIGALQEQLKELREENDKLRALLEEKEKLLGEYSKKSEYKMPSGIEIQTALRNTGFYAGKIDGVIGHQTKTAIKAFQQAEGLNPDGVVGSRTWKKLQKHLD